MRRVAVLSLALLAACRDAAPAQPDAPLSAADARPDAPPDKAALCASTFGSSLTAAFGRLDGTILAVVPPDHPTCPMPNGTHVVLQVTMNNQAYRMVINVLSTSTDPHVWLGETDAPLAGEPWSEGWHPSIALDYVTTLGVTKSQFVESGELAAIARLEDALVIGAHVSVYATSSGGASAHLVHRNLTGQDGAVVINPDTAPHYLLSAFPEQTF
jgi:hypothetical protein